MNEQFELDEAPWKVPFMTGMGYKITTLTTKVIDLYIHKTLTFFASVFVTMINDR